MRERPVPTLATPWKRGCSCEIEKALWWILFSSSECQVSVLDRIDRTTARKKANHTIPVLVLVHVMKISTQLIGGISAP
jgi:hypothetical protein